MWFGNDHIIFYVEIIIRIITMSSLETSEEDKCLCQEKRKILTLYGNLEDISKMEDKHSLKQESLPEIVQEFKSFFEERKQSSLDILYKDIILQGKITELHRHSGPQEEREPESDINGNSLLLYAMSIPSRRGTRKYETLMEIIKLLIENCPEMIVLPNRNKDFKGITPLHVAVLKSDIDCIKTMSKKLEETERPAETKGCIAEGPVFHKTALMAGTLLGVATLNCDQKVFDIVSKKFPSELDNVNHKEDNIVHSLIKYAHVQPEKQKEALDMLKYIIGCKFARAKDETNRIKIRKLLMMKNKEKLTPLQVAVKREQFKFFECIMQHEIYHPVQTDKGAFIENEYDITEIETLPPRIEEGATDHEHIKDDQHESVLEYLVHHQTDNAFHFVDFLPVREVIKEKWKYYRKLFWGWLAFHFTFMILLSVTALYRSKLSESTPENNEVRFEYLVKENIPVTVVSVFGLILGISHLILEITRLGINRFQFRTSSELIKRVKRHFSTPYSNYIFRIYFWVFSVLLFVDFVVVMAENSNPDYNNICLIFAVIIGWYLFMFFIQGFKSLSFFTVLIQRAISDLLKFAFVMLFFLVGVSVAMFMIMQGADTEDDDFNHFGKTMVKMLTIMLGIGELGILFKARQPILAILVFLYFVTLTTILLLNALIALMSNSCTDLMHSNSGMVATKYHCRLQRLSVILYLESYLPRRLCKEVGSIKTKYSCVTNKRVRRRFWSIRSVQDHTEDESENSANSLNFISRVYPSWDNLKPNRKDKKDKNTKPDRKKTYQLPKNKSVDITDVQRETCKKCHTDEVVVSQTQQIVEIANVEV